MKVWLARDKPRYLGHLGFLGLYTRKPEWNGNRWVAFDIQAGFDFDRWSFLEIMPGEIYEFELTKGDKVELEAMP